MSDHDGLRAEVESLRDVGGCDSTVDRILAVFDERDALAARVATLETAARIVCSYDGPEADAHVAAAICRDALGDDT